MLATKLKFSMQQSSSSCSSSSSSCSNSSSSAQCCPNTTLPPESQWDISPATMLYLSLEEACNIEIAPCPDLNEIYSFVFGGTTYFTCSSTLYFDLSWTSPDGCYWEAVYIVNGQSGNADVYDQNWDVCRVQSVTAPSVTMTHVYCSSSSSSSSYSSSSSSYSSSSYSSSSSSASSSSYSNSSSSYSSSSNSSSSCSSWVSLSSSSSSSLGAGGTWENEVLDAYNDDLVSVFRFFDTASPLVDCVGGHDATIVGNVTYFGSITNGYGSLGRKLADLSYVSGNAGIMQFTDNGVYSNGQHATIVYDPAYNFTQFTFAAWFATNYWVASNVPGGVPSLFYKNGVLNVKITDNNTISFYVNNDTGNTLSAQTVAGYQYYGWAFVAVRYSSAAGGTIDMFLDGTWATTATGVGTLTQNENTFYLNYPGGSIGWELAAIWDAPISNAAIESMYNDNAGREFILPSDPPPPTPPASVVLSGADLVMDWNVMEEVDINGTYTKDAIGGYWDDMWWAWTSDVAYASYSRVVSGSVYQIFWSYTDEYSTTGQWRIAPDGGREMSSEYDSYYKYSPPLRLWASGCTLALPS